MRGLCNTSYRTSHSFDDESSTRISYRTYYEFKNHTIVRTESFGVIPSTTLRHSCKSGNSICYLIRWILNYVENDVRDGDWK